MEEKRRCLNRDFEKETEMKIIKETPKVTMEGVIEQAFRGCCYCLEWGGNTGECTKCLNSVQSQLFRVLYGWSRKDEPLVV
jgi:hypothetical protein